MAGHKKCKNQKTCSFENTFIHFIFFNRLHFAPLLWVYHIEQVSGLTTPLVFLAYPKPGSFLK